MQDRKARRRELFAKAFVQGFGGGLFVGGSHPVSGIRKRGPINPMRHDLERIADDFNVSISKKQDAIERAKFKREW